MPETTTPQDPQAAAYDAAIAVLRGEGWSPAAYDALGQDITRAIIEVCREEDDQDPAEITTRAQRHAPYLRNTTTALHAAARAWSTFGRKPRNAPTPTDLLHSFCRANTWRPFTPADYEAFANAGPNARIAEDHQNKWTWVIGDGEYQPNGPRIEVFDAEGDALGSFEYHPNNDQN